MISLIYANIQNLLCDLVSLDLTSFIPSFIKIGLKLTWNKQVKKKMTDDGRRRFTE